MKYKVRLHFSDSENVIEKLALKGTRLYEFLIDSGFAFESACGGNGKCGKCLVNIRGDDSPVSVEEAQLTGNRDAGGARLACYYRINSDIDVYDIYMDQKAGEAKIMTGGRLRDIRFEPVMAKRHFKLDQPDISDQMPDIDRVASIASQTVQDSVQTCSDIRMDLLRTLPFALRENCFEVTGVYIEDELVGMEPGDTSGRMYGLAVDIGTTTVAAYLYDMTNGKRIGVHSMMNTQNKFGADVLSRIDHTINTPAGTIRMQSEIAGCVNAMIGTLARKNRIRRKDIYQIVFVGNTTMMHFLMGIPSKNIAVSPFIPVTTRPHRFRAAECGVRINPAGYAFVFPCLSAYIGADTIAAALSSGIYEGGALTLLIDIGTNGEIVLGNRDGMLACSTAAGPAFEGANIRNGTGGVSGAIDSVRFNERLEFTTIDNKKAIGICGSGIIDIIAGMLDKGIIDETGRICDAGEVTGKSPGYASRIITKDGNNAFLIAAAAECATGSDIIISQKDVREIQNAKAAISAGIMTLVRQRGVCLDDIQKVLLAGGFGSYLNIDSALTIGLLPKELEGRVESIGNAAGSGAVEGLLSKKMMKQANLLRKKIRYIELSALPDFVNDYVEGMLF